MPTCEATVYSRREPMGLRSKTCGRELRTAEQVEAKMCGRHLGGKKRSDAAMKNASDAAERLRNARQRRDDVVAKLRDSGFPCKPIDNAWGVSSPCVAMATADAEILAAILAYGPIGRTVRAAFAKGSRDAEHS